MESFLCEYFNEIKIFRKIVQDEKEDIKHALLEFSDSIKCNIVLTTGGTGISPRDVTPDVTASVVDRLVPGICEYMRMKSFEKTPNAMLSRAIAGVRSRCLIINLPGSLKAVKDCLPQITPIFKHSIGLLSGNVLNCGDDDV